MLLPPGRRPSQLDYRIGGAYLTGTTAGALLTVLVAWLLSGFMAPVPEVWRGGLLAIGAIFIWLCERGPLSGRISLPQARRQIPAEVFGGSLPKGAFRFGFELGTGVRTYVPSPAPYVLLLAILFGQLTLAWAIGIALGFGLGRAIPVLVQLATTRRDTFSQTFLQGATDVAPTVTTCLVLVGALSLV